MSRIKHLLIFAFFLLRLSLPAAAQDVNLPVDDETGLITYQEVVIETGDKASFFNQSIKWINEYYSNPVDVTKTRDPESGVVKGLHRIRLKDTLEDGVQTDAGTVQYRFHLEFRDGRYRYTLTEFVLRQASKIPCETWLNSPDSQSKSYLKQIDEFAQSWISSLKEGMMPEVEKTEDEW